MNLGGVLAPDEVIGRQHEVAAALDSLRGPGALLTGERRWGKTSVTRVVEAEAAERGHHVVRMSAERASLAEFTSALAAQLERREGRVREEIGRWRLSLSSGPFTAERTNPVASLDSLVSAAVAAAGPELLVLIVDEVPVLARTLERKEAGSGGELLHLLRRLRQDHDGLRMVLSGSIGFHHVTHDAPGTVNDVQKVPIGPLAPHHAVCLARCLLLGERVATVDDRSTAVAIAEAAEHVPYYVHHLVQTAARRPAGSPPLRPDHVNGFVEAAFVDPDDPWDLRHYRDRLRPWYGPDTPLVTAVLDELAAAGDDEALVIDELGVRLVLANTDEPLDRDRLVSVVERLEADHYLARTADGSRFTSQLVRRAWLAFRRRPRHQP